MKKKSRTINKILSDIGPREAKTAVLYLRTTKENKNYLEKIAREKGVSVTAIFEAIVQDLRTS